MNASIGTRRANLAETVIQELSSRIDNGTYGPGDKLPSEQELCKEFSVSRPVIREAVASLRLGGRLIARQGVGVFVVEQDVKRIGFAIDSVVDDVRAAAQILELRLGIEAESVARAAERRSPASMAAITEAFDRFNSSMAPPRKKKPRPISNFTWPLPAPPTTRTSPNCSKHLGRTSSLT